MTSKPLEVAIRAIRKDLEKISAKADKLREAYDIEASKALTLRGQITALQEAAGVLEDNDRDLEDILKQAIRDAGGSASLALLQGKGRASGYSPSRVIKALDDSEFTSLQKGVYEVSADKYAAKGTEV